MTGKPEQVAVLYMPNVPEEQSVIWQTQFPATQGLHEVDARVEEEKYKTERANARRVARRIFSAFDALIFFT